MLLVTYNPKYIRVSLLIWDGKNNESERLKEYGLYLIFLLLKIKISSVQVQIEKLCIKKKL